MSSGEIEAHLARLLNKTAEEVQAAWDEVLFRMIEALKADRSVTLLNICTLEPYMAKDSKYRHPVSGKMMKVPPRKYVRLMVARSLKEALRAS